jgi:hypothetical protein
MLKETNEMSGLLPQNDVTSTPDKDFFEASAEDFIQIPGSPIVYWFPASLMKVFDRKIAKGITTGDNARFLRLWWEASTDEVDYNRTQLQEQQHGRWVPCDKGGEFHKWFGNNEYVIDWSNNGSDLFQFSGSTPRNRDISFKQSIACSKISSGQVSFRTHARGFAFSDAAVGITDCTFLPAVHCFLNSTTALEILQALSPTLNFEVGQIRSLPIVFSAESSWKIAEDDLVHAAKSDWNSYETSWSFKNLLGLSATKSKSQMVTFEDKKSKGLRQYVWWGFGLWCCRWGFSVCGRGKGRSPVRFVSAKK